MRERKHTDDDYNRRLHIYADTPGMRQVEVVPSSEKELNIPINTNIAQNPATNIARNPSAIQTNPYARIPATNFVEEEQEEEDGRGRPTSSHHAGPAAGSQVRVSPPSTIPSSSSAAAAENPTLSSSTSRGAPGMTTTSAGAQKPRDPIYAELAHDKTDDDRVEQSGEKSRNDQQPLSIATGLPRSHRNSTNKATVSNAMVSKSEPNSKSVSANDRGKGESTKTLRTHTRLDASLEIPALPRGPRLRGKEDDHQGGEVLLIRKVERDPEANQQPSGGKTTRKESDAVDASGVTLKRVKSFDESHANGKSGAPSAHATAMMPIEHDLDRGTTIVKKKQRFRRNMVLIIAFLVVLLIVVGAVIISLVIVTKE